MAIKQLSVLIENKKGILSDTIKKISDAGINIRALSIGDAKEFGILRMIVSDTEEAKKVLSEDTIVNTTDVIAVKMDDKEGALYEILQVLENAEINIEYTYAFTAPKVFGAYVVIRVDDVTIAEKALVEKNITVLDASMIQDL